MEKFNIAVNGKEFEVQTPLLKGAGDLVFRVFQNNSLSVTLSPCLTKNNRLAWKCGEDGMLVQSKEQQLIGKAIEQYYQAKPDSTIT